MSQPQSIEALLHHTSNGRTNLLGISPTNSHALTQNNPTSPAIIKLHQRFGQEPTRIMSQFNPSLQVQYCKDVKRVHTGTAPSVGLIARAYGNNVAESWVEIQLNDLSEFAGVKEKLNEKQITELAKRLIDIYGYWKLTEFMLFFSRFKNCRYGKFYGAVDPMIIMAAAEDFQQERLYALQQYENEKRREEEAEQERQFQALRQRYTNRVPDAWTDTAPIDFFQYRMLGYDSMPDEQFSKEIAALQSGEKEIPKDYRDILNYVKTAYNAE